MSKSRGRFLGAALGYTFLGPLGALIGAAIGFAVDSKGTGSFAGYSKESRREIAYVEKLILFLTGAARADGRVTPHKLGVIGTFFRERLGYRGPSEEIVRRLVAESLGRAVDLPAVCAAIAARTDYEERLFLTQLAYRVAVADGLLVKPEENYIEDAARLLGVGDYDLAMIARPFQRFKGKPGASGSGGGEGGPRDAEVGAAPADPYGVLGLRPGCGDDEIVKAYRALASRYHPDKVLHLGREFVELANRKFTEIARAYEELKKARGLA